MNIFENILEPVSEIKADQNLGRALLDMLESTEHRVDLKALPEAFFDYFEVTEMEKAA